MSHALAILGAGNMAEAIVRGLLRAGSFAASDLIAADISPQRRALFENELGIRTTDSPAHAVADAGVVLLSVKPQQMGELLGMLAPVLGQDALLVSIAAGISTAAVERGAGGERRRVVRAMPNTPMLVGEGMVAIAAGAHATAADLATAEALFAPAAKVITVTEPDLDAVTAVSGSGPAYVFFLVEQMIAAGEELGLSRENATLLASQTALGAAVMLTRSSDTPAELRRKVTSPGGTTHAAVSHMEAQKLPRILVDAVKAAHRRSRELAG